MSDVLLSIVTGTINRLDQLQRMVGSVRNQLPRGITYEFVIADNGSTDGTPEWVKSQKGMNLIQHGDAVGAIKAFTSAAEWAEGKYVLLANDDIVIEPGSILNAIRHLEDNATCGAVAFKNNRNNGTDYGVQYHQVRSADGSAQRGVYMCVGIVRRELGNDCGWWEGDNGQMSDAWTYGGDNALSQEIHARGFTIDVLDQCRNTDIGVMDDTRARGHERHHNDGAIYRKYYEGGLVFGSKPYDYTHKRNLRILYLTGFANEQPWHKDQKVSLRNAFSDVGHVVELNYLDPNKKWMHDELVRLMRWWQPHLVFANLHSGKYIDTHVWRHARAVSPKSLCVNWIGDVWDHIVTEPAHLEMWHNFDLTLVVNAKHIELLKAQGIKADFWGSTFEHVDDSDLPDMPAFDVVFQGNMYNHEGKRKALGEAVRSVGGGLFGGGWANPDGNTFYNFGLQRAVYNNAKIAISDNQFPDTSEGYTSNRFYNAMASGVCVFHQHSPGFQQWLGFEAGKHYVEWTDLDDLRGKIAHYLDSDKERVKIARAGKRYVRRWHSPEARVKELITQIIPRQFPKKEAA